MVMFWQIMESEFGGDPAGGADWMQWVRLVGSALAELMQVYLNKYRGVYSFFGMVTGFRFFMKPS
jgi:hypothetical protein